VPQTELKARLPGDDLRGEVTVADSVIAKLAGRTALATYGSSTCAARGSRRFCDSFVTSS